MSRPDDMLETLRAQPGFVFEVVEDKEKKSKDEKLKRTAQELAVLLASTSAYAEERYNKRFRSLDEMLKWLFHETGVGLRGR